MARLLVALAALAGGERLPEPPSCVHSCNPTAHIYPDSGNKRRIWPECPSADGDCRSTCADRLPDCTRYAAAYDGHGCHDNPPFMLSQCPSSCNACHIASPTERCAHLLDVPRALRPGSVSEMFRRLTALEGVNASVLSSDPWVVLVHNALRDDELATLLRPDRPWALASDAGAAGADGRSTKVFSSNRKTDVHWCKAGCIDEPAVVRLISRISEMVMVHPDYFETPQLLRYAPGMYYRTHHDAAGRGPGSAYAGLRVYTAFIYLSDVDGGGETNFPDLGITVKPERGAMLLWPSVTDDDPTKVDMRTRHGARLPSLSQAERRRTAHRVPRCAHAAPTRAVLRQAHCPSSPGRSTPSTCGCMTGRSSRRTTSAATRDRSSRQTRRIGNARRRAGARPRHRR